ncbi:calcium-activated chloride channel regulator 4A-like [Hyalella azteca]|uniref:Calcium-activated chloride channel regulator 4A-like n=1 Tax=Hyalella azteca TaxID=294128 RepID=A0A8B7NNF3_HYAAZ|nr:calcium-activated chloride channel regulator 4A-like [Hyalella azteca]
MEEKTRLGCLYFKGLAIIYISISLYSHSVGCVTVENNVYKDVYVAIRSDVPESECEAAVANLETAFNEASGLLFQMTESRLYFDKQLYVVLPSHFKTCGRHFNESLSAAAPAGYSYLRAPIRMGRTHGIFGDDIWTQQPRQCGQSGDFISMATASVANNTYAARDLVKEWAKFRWGVMDEEGHAGDSIHPPGYASYDGSYLPNACVDSPLSFSLSDCSSEQDCIIDPEINTNQTSSILSVPHLPNVVKMCTAATHNKHLPTKQNLLCAGLSAMEVFLQHNDSNVRPITGSFSVPSIKTVVARVNPIISSIIMAVEFTKPMVEHGYEFEYVMDGICQALEAYLQDGISFGLLLFQDSKVSLVGESLLGSELVVLNSTVKQTICYALQVAFEEARPISSTDRSIANVLGKATQLLPSAGGAILLITKPRDETDDVNDVATKAELNTVWPLLYSHDGQNIAWYESLSQKTGSDAVLTVRQALNNDECQAVMRMELSRALQQILSNNQVDELTQLSSQACSLTGNTKTCSASFTIDPSVAADNYLVSVYYPKDFQSINVSNAGADCTKLQYDVQTDSSSTLNCSSLPSKIDVTSHYATSAQTIYSEVVAKAAVISPTTISNMGKSSIVNVDVNLNKTNGIYIWTSENSRDLKFTATSAPAVFAQVFVDGREVVGARVSLALTILNSTAGLPGTQLPDIVMRDTGTGADVTGNDGIYSAFLAFSSGNDSSIQTPELSLEISASGQGFFLPDSSEALDPPLSCCGSSLPLPSTLSVTPKLDFKSSIRGRVTSPLPANLPPGSISDLSASTAGSAVRLTFTAPGADLDAGTVSGYIVTTFSSPTEEGRNHSTRSGIVAAGSRQSLDLSKDTVGCDLYLDYYISAFDELGAVGPTSNSVKHLISCSAGEKSLSAGAIVGITIGAVVLLIIIVLIIYLCCNWDRRQQTGLWQCLTCSKSSNKKKTTAKDTPSKSSQRPTSVEVIRSIDDLYTKPEKSITKKAGGGVTNEGFEGTTKKPAPVPNPRQRNRNDNDSIASYGSRELEKFNMPYDLRDSTLQTTLPINKVGIPVPGNDARTDHARTPYAQSLKSSPSPSQLPIYPNYNSNSGMFDMEPKQAGSLPDYSTNSRDSPYGYDQRRPASVSELRKPSPSNLNTLV